ncbi:ATP-binding protein [Anaerobium acetethylicum]|uniref:4Fe-4S binding domain-containing protein n=1 Tax=Anaerobium acetethylicum TaxID=1619234 RepID=A0A1D3TN98_9FIRM|nr:4Fe-4S dicluster domain-containing protein [Anaerobium acetethylicum]SCP94768.1 4Fe-4S binding domain-containing protein [Anaerobium acetethylicum]
MATTNIKSKRIAEVMEKGCVACGSCMNVCPRDAITVPKGIIAVVDNDKCIGCGLCKKACPASVIEIKPRPEA